MPHLTLNYTDNISIKPDFDEVFTELHHTLRDLANIQIDNCKSKALAFDTYYIGNGNKDESFVHLEVKFLEGRNQELKNLIGDELLAKLKNRFLSDSSEQRIQITIELLDIKKPNYFKYTKT